MRLLLVLLLSGSNLLAAVRFIERPGRELGIDEIAGQPSFVDLNQDGLLDFWAGVAYLNNGNGTFEKMPNSRWPGGECLCFGDYNNDGYPDILTNAWRQDTTKVRIYENDGPPDFHLTEVTDQTGIGIPVFERDLVDAVWFDYDSDSWLDCYVSSYEYPFPIGHEDYLFHSDSGWHFTDVSVQSGIASVALCSRGVSISDFDEDADPDVFVSVYRLEPNLLWQNQGDGTFTDVAADKGVQGLYIGGYYGHNIGAQWADYNNDGHMDLMSPITHHSGYPGDSTGHLWLSNGPPDFNFTCVWPKTGMRNTEIGSAPLGGDYDNDGDVDLFWVNLYGQPQADAWLYRNNGDTTFTNVTQEANLYFPGQVRNFAIFADFNEDGFLDLFWPRTDGQQTYWEFLENSADNGNHWLEVDLVGTRSNRSGIGARIDAFAGNWRAVREVFHNGGNGYGSPFVARQHFGLGQHAVLDSLVIAWPSGTRDVYRNLPADRFVRSTEGSLDLVSRPALRVPRSGSRLLAQLTPAGVLLTLSGVASAPACTVVDRLGRVVAEVEQWQRTEDGFRALWPGRGCGAGVYFFTTDTPSGPVSAKALLVR